MKLDVVVYTMDGCPHCVEFKKMLTEANIPFHDRDVFTYEKEYNMYVEVTKSEFVPS